MSEREIKITIKLPHWLTHRWGHCLTKVDYKSKSTAEKAIAAMSKKHVQGLEAYECQYCGGWHIGHRRGA